MTGDRANDNLLDDQIRFPKGYHDEEKARGHSDSALVILFNRVYTSSTLMQQSMGSAVH